MAPSHMAMEFSSFSWFSAWKPNCGWLNNWFVASYAITLTVGSFLRRPLVCIGFFCPNWKPIWLGDTEACGYGKVLVVSRIGTEFALRLLRMRIGYSKPGWSASLPMMFSPWLPKAAGPLFTSDLSSSICWSPSIGIG